MADVRHALRKVGRVQRGRQRRLGHPQVAHAGCRTACRALRVNRGPFSSLVGLAVFAHVATHLGVGLATGGLERVLARGPWLTPTALVPLLTSWWGDANRASRRSARVPGHCERGRARWNPVTIEGPESTEGDQHDARDDASVLKELAHGQFPFLRSLIWRLRLTRSIRTGDCFGGLSSLPERPPPQRHQRTHQLRWGSDKPGDSGVRGGGDLLAALADAVSHAEGGVPVERHETHRMGLRGRRPGAEGQEAVLAFLD